MSRRRRKLPIKLDGLLLTLKDRANVTTKTIWGELSERLRQFIRSRVQLHADADDIMQKVFLRIHQKNGEPQQVNRLEFQVF